MADQMPEPDPVALADAHAILDAARSVTVLTGAGISTDSGIPDFRGPNGLWTRNPKAERLAHIDHYVRDPEVRALAWQGRLQWIESAPEPNAGHRALVELERRGVLYALVTQNVDGLHQAAGHDPARVVEVHGTIHEVVCLSCDAREPAGPTLDRVRSGESDPHCLRCGGLLKSATISFGQGLRPTDLARAFEAAESCDVLLAVGSSLSVYPVAGMVPHARRSGASVVIVNAEATEMDELADVVVRGSLSLILPQLVGPGAPGTGGMDDVAE
ncbi:MAG: Sir2 family NAD-dependent protein deacetylase [Acidimicrobiales bacterium]